MNNTDTLPMQRLLQHRQWVRNLARALVLDEARADDLEQQTWLAALERPPEGDTPKAWLGTVMRNLAARMRRSEYRVDRREGVAARAERLPATSDVVAQAELHKEVVQAVLALDEPYRETVLLRHYEGLPPREIAQRMGVAVETVRSRVRRGLQQVRTALAAKHGGDDRAWRLALVPLARLADGGAGASATASATLGTGALLMSTPLKSALAFAALLLLVGGAWFLWTDDEVADEDNAPTEHADADTESQGPELHAKGATESAARTEADAEKQDAPPPMGAGAAWVRVVRGPEAAPRGVASAGVVVAASRGVTFDLEADAWGRAELPARALGFPTTLWILDEAGSTIARRRATLGEGEFLVRLPAPQRIEMQFLDEQGNVLSAAEVKRRYDAAGMRPVAHIVSSAALSSTDRSVQIETMLGLSRSTAFAAPLTFEADAIRLALAPAAGRWQLLVDRPGAAPDLSEPFQLDGSAGALRVVMQLPATPKTARVRITDPEGNALAGAAITPYFEVGDDAAFFATSPRMTDERGEAELPLLKTEGRGGQRAPTWWATHGSHVVPITSYRLQGEAAGEAIRINAHLSATVKGRAYTPTGEPAVGRTIIWGRKGYRRRTTVAEDGSYELTGISVGDEGNANLWMIDDLERASLRQASVRCKAGETSTYDFGKLVRASEIGTIEGRITEAGAPLPGVLLMVKGQQERGKGRTATTGADGSYSLPGLAPGSYRLLVILGDFRVSDDYQIVSNEGLKVTGGLISTYDFDLPGGHVELTLLDAETGKPVPGGLAVAEPRNKKDAPQPFPGFRAKLGWAQAADAQGIVRLRALPTDVDLRVRYGSRTGYELGEMKTVRAGTKAEPTRVELKLKKKP